MTKQTLPTGERTLLVTRATGWKLFLNALWTLGLYTLWWRSRMLELTNRRLIYREGVLSRVERSVSLEKIQDVTVEMSLLGRILGYGTIYIETAGSSGPEFMFRDAQHPDRLHDAIFAAQAALKAQEDAV